MKTFFYVIGCSLFCIALGCGDAGPRRATDGVSQSEIDAYNEAEQKLGEKMEQQETGAVE